IVDILEVPEPGATELFDQVSVLPLAEPPAPGDVIDGFRIDARLADGRYSRLLRATDLSDGEEVVLKFPQSGMAPASTWHHAFVREAWVAARLHSPWIGASLTLAPGRQSCLDSVMPWYPGETLEQRLRRRPAVTLDEGVQVAGKLARRIAAVARAGIVHRDMKPENVLLECSGGLKLIDLGVVRLPLLEEIPGSAVLGTPSYMAPELFAGEPCDELSD